MERYQIPSNNPLKFRVAGDNYYNEPTRRRSRSFGSKSDWNGYRDIYYENTPHRSYSMEFVPDNSLKEPAGVYKHVSSIYVKDDNFDNSLQENTRPPKYVSSVHVKDDSFAINSVQVPGQRRGPYRYYSEPGRPQHFESIGYQNPAYISRSEGSHHFKGIRHHNPVYVSDSESDRTGKLKKYKYLYLPSRNPMHLPHSEDRAHLDDKYSGGIERSEPYHPRTSERQCHTNAAFMHDDEQKRNGKSFPYSGSNDRISQDVMEMATIACVSSTDINEVNDTNRYSHASLQSSAVESSMQESSLETTTRSRMTYLVDDPRYIMEPGAAIGKQQNEENKETTDVQRSPSESIGSRLRKSLKCHKPHPTRWGPRKRVCISITASIILVGLILFLSLLPLSFLYLEYDQIALRRTKSTWKVHDKTYYPGCYLHGPDMEFYSYSSAAHREIFDQIDVFTADKNTLKFSATIFWFIRSEELPDLYNKFGRNFSLVFPNMFLSTMRNVAPLFTSRDYLSKRDEIDATMHQALYDKVSGTCCPSCCSWRTGCSNNFTDAQCSRCSQDPSCDKGHHIDLRYFYLGEIEIPEQIESRYLKSIVVKFENEKAQYEQEVAVTRIKNDHSKKNILNEADVIEATSEAEAEKIKAIAEVEADVIHQKVTASALSGMCSKFNITEEDHKLSLFFFSSIKGMDNLSAFIYDN